MEWISVKLPPTLRAKVAAKARRRNVSQSTIVRELLERALAGPTSRGEANCADLAGSLVGSLRSGRRVFSTNKNRSLMRWFPTHAVAASVIVDTGPIVALSTMISSMHGAKRNSRVFGRRY